jgi:hypothetical protein
MPAHFQFFSFLLLASLLFQVDINAQGSDIIALKKGNHRTLKTYFAGTQIQFITIAGTDVQGMIRKIEKDSLYINIYDSRPQYTIWGTSFWDTVSVSLYRYHYKEIREIMKPPQHFSFVRNGFIFIMGGFSYAFLHSVNALYLKEKIDPKTLAFSGGSVLAGLLLKKLHRNTIRIGKQHYLQYIPLK